MREYAIPLLNVRYARIHLHLEPQLIARYTITDCLAVSETLVWRTFCSKLKHIQATQGKTKKKSNIVDVEMIKFLYMLAVMDKFLINLVLLCMTQLTLIRNIL